MFWRKDNTGPNNIWSNEMKNATNAGRVFHGEDWLAYRVNTSTISLFVSVSVLPSMA
jgi:hypothetical protein